MFALLFAVKLADKLVFYGKKFVYFYFIPFSVISFSSVVNNLLVLVLVLVSNNDKKQDLWHLRKN